jgi:hypothetical protein
MQIAADMPPIRALFLMEFIDYVPHLFGVNQNGSILASGGATFFM